MSGDNFVAVVAILAIFGLPLIYAIVNRALSYIERVEMIKHGMVPPQDPRWNKAAKYAAKYGYGPGPTPQGAPQNYQPDAYGYNQYQAYRTLRGGITVAMVGLALLIGLSFIGPLSGIGPFGPWLLGGLIPLFVGIAQIITALLSGARIGPWGFDQTTFPGQVPPQQPGAAQYQQPPPFGAPPRDVPPGPYAWRPGPTAELERPVPPPDVKQ